MNAPGRTLGSVATAAGDDGEAALWEALKGQGDILAREQLFTLYFPFARQIAKRRYLDRRSGDIEFQELCQLAYTGLLEALDAYDPGYGTPFKGFASRRISGAILDGIPKMSEVREQISFRNRVRRGRVRSLVTSDPDTLSSAQAMEALIEAAVGLAIGFMLEAATLGADAEPSVPATAYDSLVWKEISRRLAAEIANLPAREHAVIRHHYLQGLTFDQIASLTGVTKGRVSQVHKAALMMLRRRLGPGSDFKLER